MTNFPLCRCRCYVSSKETLQGNVTRCLKQNLSLYVTEENVLSPEGMWKSRLAHLHFEFLLLLSYRNAFVPYRPWDPPLLAS